MRFYRFNLIWLGLVLLSLACNQAPSIPETSPEAPPARFRLRSPSISQLDFTNKVKPEVEFNILNYPYFYNGGGVAVGDLNGDELPDLYFTANQGPNRLYLNRGDLTFEDVTESAGVAGSGDWSTGVSLIDINADGQLDIYVSNVSGLLGQQGRNELFLNLGEAKFEEVALDWGLAQSGYATQSSFFDYDGDGDLDCFQLNHSIRPSETVGPASQRATPDSLAGNRLLRNEGNKFVDVSREAGIYRSRLGYGLGVLTADIDQNGWPDLYVCNDFHEDDYLYLNQGDGTFQESLREHFGHTSKFSMGGDVADINNDGLADLITLDMKPYKEFVRKTSQAPESFDRYAYKLSFGYYYQYAHNALQVQSTQRNFQEVSQMMGVDATDWSWSALFCDLDNDGWKDLYITNGIYRRPDDMDYISFISDPAITRQLNGEPSEADLSFIQRMPSLPQPNFAFRNLQGVNFQSEAKAWGLAKAGFSSGAVYADLDRDGDLDLVVNNLNARASLYENQSIQQDSSHFLGIKLEGDSLNPFGIGARVWLWTKEGPQFQEHYPTRGFQSCVEPGWLHFGLGGTTQVDSLLIKWPDRKTQRLYSLKGLRFITLKQDSATSSSGMSPQISPSGTSSFQAVSAPLLQNWTHMENKLPDFNREPLIPHRLSTQGPRIAKGDANGDGLEDLYLPGPAGQSGQLLLQTSSGKFQPDQGSTWASYSHQEEVAATFFDADQDGDLDLYVACGGHEFYGNDARKQDRLFFNENGRFQVKEGALPHMPHNSSHATPADVDGDGDIDLFIGVHSITGQYGMVPPSFLLINQAGSFTDMTDSLAPVLRSLGLVTDALWHDYDHDGDPDLIAVGEWMPLTLLHNEGGSLRLKEGVFPDSTHGWWNRMALADLDGDGDQDLVATNLGFNSSLQATPSSPCALYVSDFDGNGASDPILCYFREGRSFPWHPRDELLKQLPNLRRRYPNYQTYAEAGIKDLFTPEQLSQAVHHEVYTFAHTWFERQGDQFIPHPLPRATQVAPLYGIAAKDLNQDGIQDLVLGGNFFGVDPKRGRYDASLGHLLWGSPQGPSSQHGHKNLDVKGEIRDMVYVNLAGRTLLLIGRNSDSLTWLEFAAEEGM